MIDSWYPAVYMRAARRFAADGWRQLTDPPAATLLGAEIAFAASDSAYREVGDRLVIAQLMSADGHHHERVEI